MAEELFGELEGGGVVHVDSEPNAQCFSYLENGNF